MKRVTEPLTLLMWANKLARVVGIGEGKTIHLEFIEQEPCKHCGRSYGVDVLEHSPLFQDNAEAVMTLEGK